MQASDPKQPVFLGTFSGLLELFLKNAILLTLTLGFYYPWTRTEFRHFYWQNIDFLGDRFEYTGTGSEIFRGYLKFFGLYLLLFSIPKIAEWMLPILILGWVQAGVAIIVSSLIPFLVYNSIRYLASRTRYRGVHFNLSSGMREYLSAFYKGAILTLLSFGLYYPIFRNTLRATIFNHLKFGNLSFRYTVKDSEIFSVFMTGVILSSLTLGVYSFRSIAVYKNTIISGIHIGKARLAASFTAWDVFLLTFGAVLVSVVTLGFAVPWIRVASMRLIASRIRVEGELELDHILQNRDLAGAAGDAASDAFELDIGVV